MATVNEKMTAIADTIRIRTGIQDKLSLDGMAQAIPQVYEAGYDNGCSFGYGEGLKEGKQAQYDEFWDTYQDYGNRIFYQYAFAGRGAWKPKILKPKYDIKLTNAQGMFAFFQETGRKLDLREIGVDIDFSQCAQFNMAFQYALDIAAIGVLNLQKAPSLSSSFDGAQNLHTIEKLILKSDGSQTFASCFGSCSALKNIIFEGVIGNNIDFKSCPLSKDSIMGKPITTEEYEVLSDVVKNNNIFYFDGVYHYGGVITALSKTATGRTLTLNKNAVNQAFGIDVDDESTYPEGSEFYKLRHSKDNWSFSYI